MTILTAFSRAVEAHPDRIAVIDGKSRATSYEELNGRAAALAENWRGRGVGPGDAVLIAMPVTADLYASLAALWRLGAYAVLPEPAMGLRGVKHAIEAQPIKAWIGGGMLRVLPFLVPALRKVKRLPVGKKSCPASPPSEWPDTHPALMSFTSGSTGRPKAIMRNHGFLKAQNEAVSPLLSSDRDEIDLVGFPVFVLANIALGITSVLPNWPLRDPAKADAAAIRKHCAQHGVTRLLLPPAMAELLADAPLPQKVDRIFTGGGPVFPDVVERLTAINPDLRLVAVYGSTEAEPIAECELSAISDADREAMATGAGLLAGLPASGARVRIIEDEIQVAGGHVVSGYVDPADDAKTKVRDKDGTIWHRTGDGGRFDDNGRLWLRGRIAGRSGRLWPFEIEVAARSWPLVEKAALVPVDGKGVLAIQGDERGLPNWQTLARKLKVNTVVALPRIPLDQRHRSKVDYAALEGEIRAAL